MAKAASRISSRENVKVTLEGTRILIEIETDPAKVETVPSGSGKSIVIASTGGNRPLPGTDLVMGLNLYRKV